MLRKRYTYDALTQLDWAVEENNLEKVKELIEGEEAGITNLHFASAVHSNHQEIVKYFLEKATEIVGVIDLGLYVAIKDKNLEAVTIIVRSLKEHKERYLRQNANAMIAIKIHNVDYVVAQALLDVGQCFENDTLTVEEMLQYTKTIVECYYQ